MHIMFDSYCWEISVWILQNITDAQWHRNLPELNSTRGILFDNFKNRYFRKEIQGWKIGTILFHFIYKDEKIFIYDHKSIKIGFKI